MIDTHTIYKRLTGAGVSQAESEAIVETSRELSDSPTRGDIKELEATFVKWMVESLGLMTAILLGGVYYLTSDIKNDVRELRTRTSVNSK
jgi:hypothetical protein